MASCATSIHTTASMPPNSVKTIITKPRPIIAPETPMSGKSAASTKAVSSSRTPSPAVRMSTNSDAASAFTAGPKRVCSSS